MKDIKSKISIFLFRYHAEIIAALIVCIAASAMWCLTSLKYATDDQFILFRYIDNIAYGKGFVYNIGDRILGSTTPLYTLVSALIKYMFISFPTPDLLAYVNIVYFSLSAVFFYRVSRHFLSERFSLLAVLVFALSLSKIVPEGMETSLFILLIFAFLDCLLSEKYYWSSILLALVILTRPDAGLIAVLALIYWYMHTSFEKSVRFTVLTIVVTLPWLVFSILYFGTFIPQSVVAKLHINDIIRQSRFQAVKVQLASLSRTYWGKIFDPDNIVLQVIFNLLPFLGFVSLALWKKLNRDTWIVFAIPFVYFISYSISNPVMFPWYISQMEPFWILISFVGAAVLLEKIPNTTVKIFLVLCMLAGPAFFWVQRTETTYQNKTGLLNVGLYIKEHMNPNDTIGANNFGMIGYASNAYIIDFFGLINDYATGFYPIKDSCVDPNQMFTIAPGLIKQRVPNWIVVSNKAEFVPCFFASDWFQQHYSAVNVDGFGTDTIWRLKSKN